MPSHLTAKVGTCAGAGVNQMKLCHQQQPCQQPLPLPLPPSCTRAALASHPQLLQRCCSRRAAQQQAQSAAGSCGCLLAALAAAHTGGRRCSASKC